MSANFRPKSALIVGLGNGMVAYGVAELPSIEKVTVIELMPSVVNLVFKYSGTQLRQVLQGPKVEIVTGDGRRFLQRVGTSTKYDLIQVAVFHPWTSGASNVYTKEFFQLLSLHLNPGGVVAILSYYPLVDSTAHLVFPFGYKLKGWNNRFHYFSNSSIDFQQAVQATEVASPEYCTWAGLNSSHLELFRIKPAQRKYANTDDRPLLEYFFLKQIFQQFAELPTSSLTEIIGTTTLRCRREPPAKPHFVPTSG